ncbi:MAG: hypothetical protein V3S70_03090 [Gammaproteobacteria bacterium]
MKMNSDRAPVTSDQEVQTKSSVFSLQSSAFAFGFVFLSLAGCSDPGSPEEQVRALIANAETAAQEKQLGDLRSLVSDSYVDGRGNDKQQIVQMLRIYLLRHQSVHLYVHVESVEFPVPELASVSLVVGMAGRGISEGSDWRINADLYNITLELEGDASEWQVISADWQRAGR